MKHFTLNMFLSFLFSISIFAQNDIGNKTDNDISVLPKKENINAVNDKIEFKNESGNSILTLTDEGNNSASVELKDVNGNAANNKKLQNNSGDLYWGSNQLSGGTNSLKGLSDVIYNGSSLFLGEGAGVNNGETTLTNTAVGHYALNSQTTGGNNIAIGTLALSSNTIGAENTAIGLYSLLDNENGLVNIALGNNSLTSNLNGNFNTGLGYYSLSKNISGSKNTAIGFYSLSENINGSNGVAVGYYSQYLANNTTDINYINYNTSIGFESLRGSLTPSNNIGNYNSAVGYQALLNNANGSYNSSNGMQALQNNSAGSYNTAIGANSLTFNETGSLLTAIGALAGVSSSDIGLVNSTAIGYNATVNAHNQVRIGNSLVTSIGGYKNWTNISDERYKQNIRNNVVGLDFILGLKPITYNLNILAIAEKLGEDERIVNDGNALKEQPNIQILASRAVKESVRQSGFSAQDVEKLANSLDYDFSGVDKPNNEDGFYGLRYSEFVVPLVKAVQEQQEIINKLSQRIEELEMKQK